MLVTHTEDLTEQVNGFTAVFSTSVVFMPGTLVVELNGQRLRPGSGHDYVETSFNTFEMNYVPEIGEVVLAQFEVEDAGAGYPLVIAYGYDPTVM